MWDLTFFSTSVSRCTTDIVIRAKNFQILHCQEIKEKEKMRIIRKKAAVIAFTLILSTLMIASAMLIPPSSAHSPAWNIVTHAYVAAFPSPVGVGQTAYVNMWLDKVIDGSDLSNDIRFHDYQLVITAPDGSKETKTFPVVSDPTSNQMYSFTPNHVGTYTFNFSFPGQKYTFTTPIISFFGPSGPKSIHKRYICPKQRLNNINGSGDTTGKLPTTPLPSEYWSRPIYGLNSNWWAISSNWLGNSAPGYSTMNGGSFPGDSGRFTDKPHRLD